MSIQWNSVVNEIDNAKTWKHQERKKKDERKQQQPLDVRWAPYVSNPPFFFKSFILAPSLSPTVFHVQSSRFDSPVRASICLESDRPNHQRLDFIILFFAKLYLFGWLVGLFTSSYSPCDRNLSGPLSGDDNNKYCPCDAIQFNYVVCHNVSASDEIHAVGTCFHDVSVREKSEFRQRKA